MTSFAPSVIALALAAASSNLMAEDVDVDAYAAMAVEEQRKELAGRSSLCSHLSEKACSQMEYVFSPDAKGILLDENDRLLLSEVMSLGSTINDSSEAPNRDRLRAVQNAGSTLGHALGSAHESSRYNMIWEDAAGLLDEAVRFDVLMLDSEYGTNILPPIINQVSQYTTTIEDGRTFRAAGRIYVIQDQPKFVRSAPTWRSYLKLTYKKPKLPSRSLLPTTEEEKRVFRVALVRGYEAGIETASQRARVAYETLINDFNGMVLYHLLLSYEMVTKPIVDSTYNAVSVNSVGNEMAVDDLIMRIKVLPRLEGNRNKWKALPVLEEFEHSLERRHIRVRLGGSS